MSLSNKKIDKEIKDIYKNNIMKVTDPVVFRKKIRDQINKYLKNEALSINLEKGIFNYAIGAARKRKVVRKWDSSNFVLLYINKVRNIIDNINHIDNIDIIHG